jgi:hypothetical protein
MGGLIFMRLTARGVTLLILMLLLVPPALAQEGLLAFTAAVPEEQDTAISQRLDITRRATAARADAHARAYDAWLKKVGVDRILRVHRVIPGTPILAADDPEQTWTVHLLLPGGVTYDHSIVHQFWTSLREQFATGGDLEQRLLFRAGQQLAVPVQRMRVLITRVPDDDCWRVTVAITDAGYVAAEHTCVSTTTDPSVFGPLRDVFWRGTHGACGVTSTTRSQTRVVIDALEQRLRQRYTKGRYEALSRTDVLREVSVDRIRNEVLKDAGRWEKLKIVLVAVPRKKDVEIVLNVDGQYAPGVGKTPPQAASYRDMEPQHAAALTEYTKALLMSITTP